jgi:prepilin peptidase CpaA
MLGLTPFQIYQVFLVLCLPICAWVVWSDLKTMKIPNKSVIALIGVFVFAGLVVMPLEPWLWRWLNFAVVLAIGFVLNAVANVGAGDAKFAAAAALFVTASHAGFILPLFAAFLLAAFAAHRIFRAIPAVVRATPDWVSWQRKDFPMGLALVGTFVTYLAFRAIPPFEAWVQGVLVSMRM